MNMAEFYLTKMRGLSQCELQICCTINVIVGDFNNFTDFTDVADFTNFKALFEPCHSNGCKVVDFNNLFQL